jgi:hypothetical protein
VHYRLVERGCWLRHRRGFFAFVCRIVPCHCTRAQPSGCGCDGARERLGAGWRAVAAAAAKLGLPKNLRLRRPAKAAKSKRRALTSPPLKQLLGFKVFRPARARPASSDRNGKSRRKLDFSRV